MINALLLAVSEEQLRSNLRGDLPLVILGSIIAAIGLAAVVVHLSRWQSGERVLLWFGLFAGPCGLRLLTNTTPFQMAFGEPEGVWPFANKLVEFATLVPALLGVIPRQGMEWLRWPWGEPEILSARDFLFLLGQYLTEAERWLSWRGAVRITTMTLLKTGHKRLEISACGPQKDSLRANCTRRGLFTVEFTEPNPRALTSFTGKPNWV